MKSREAWDMLRQDTRYAARGLRREPLFTAFVVTTLALGIGANAAMFGVVDRLLVRGPEHLVDPSRVMRVYARIQPPGMDEVTRSTFGYVTYDLLRRNTHSFARRAQTATGAPPMRAPASRCTKSSSTRHRPSRYARPKSHSTSSWLARTT